MAVPASEVNRLGQHGSKKVAEAQYKEGPSRSGQTLRVSWYITYPTGSFEMVDGKTEWKYVMEMCGECGTCRYV